MRPVRIRMSAAGRSAWVPVDRTIPNFNVGLAGIPSSNGNLTWGVQHTFDDFSRVQSCQVTRSTTTATVKLANHGLSNGDYASMQGTGSDNLNGDQTVTVVDQNTFTYAVSNTGATADTGDAKCVTARVFDHLVLQSQSGRADSNYVNPITACRLYVSAYVAGYVDLDIIQGHAQ